MGFIRDVFGGGRKPKDLPPVPTPAGDALQGPLTSGLAGKGFDPAGEGRSRRFQTRAVNEAFVGGERDFNRVLERTLQRGDTAPREVAKAQRLRGRNLRLESIEQSGATINFEQRLQAQDIGLGVAGNELSTNQQIATATTNSRIRRIFAPDFNEGIAEGIGAGLGFATGSGTFERDTGQTVKGGSESFTNPPGIIESQAPSTSFFQKFSIAQSSSL